MYEGSNCARKSQLSEILREPLNPCDRSQIQLRSIISQLLLIDIYHSSTFEDSSYQVKFGYGAQTNFVR